jgi:pimeloyl-ACP methyl ester carboxylesterase
MAEDLLAATRALGHATFALAGHDRGGRVGYRMALDYPDAVTRLAVLDIVPTGEIWRRVRGRDLRQLTRLDTSACALPHQARVIPLLPCLLALRSLRPVLASQSAGI